MKRFALLLAVSLSLAVATTGCRLLSAPVEASAGGDAMSPDVGRDVQRDIDAMPPEGNLQR